MMNDERSDMSAGEKRGAQESSLRDLLAVQDLKPAVPKVPADLAEKTSRCVNVEV